MRFREHWRLLHLAEVLLARGYAQNGYASLPQPTLTRSPSVLLIVICI